MDNELEGHLFYLLSLLRVTMLRIEWWARVCGEVGRCYVCARLLSEQAIRGAAVSLGSLRRLTANMPQIAIHHADRAKNAVREMDTALHALASGDLAEAAYHSGNAYVSADRAFFDKHMVAQTFVPDEHKLDVYAPLLGPLMVVILSGWVRFLRERKAL